jgi:transcriptional regulator with XRE-family HTH domain
VTGATLTVPKLDRLRAVRESQLLTQQDLAAKAGVHHVTISRIETGEIEPRFRTIRALADALGVDWHELVDPADATG